MEGRHCLCVEIEGEKLRFGNPSNYIQHQLNKGFNFGQSTLKPEEPSALQTCKLEPLPSKESLCGDSKETDYFSGILSAGRKRSTTQLKLLASGDDVQDLSKPLLLACVKGSPSATQLVLTESTHVNLNAPLQCSNEQELTPLSLASISPSPQVCEVLIKSGAGVNQTDQLGRSALHWAVLGHQLGIVRVLLKHGADVTLEDNKGFTPLLYGCVLGAHDLVSRLLKEGGGQQVDHPHTPTNLTPLMIACLKGHTDVAKLLLKHRANPSLTDSQGYTAPLYAVWSGGHSLKCVKMILSQCGRAVLSQRDAWGRTPLLIAAAKGDPQMCQFLLKKGVWLGEVDNEGRTALHWAILSQQISCVEFFLGYTGGDQLINQPDNSGANPAHYAAISSDEHILQLLKAKEGSMVASDHSGYGVLLWAAVCGRVSSVKLIKESINDRDILDEGEEKGEGSPSNMLHPLHGAASVGSVEVCQVLLDSEGNKNTLHVNTISPSGLTPLHYASRYGHTHCVQLLLSNGAHVDSLTPQQESPLHLASTHGHGGVADELLSNGAVIDRPLGQSGDCPVHIACAKGHVELLQVLVRHGCKVDQPRSSDHQCPLHLAASNGHLSCCKVLVEKQCNVSATLPTVERLTALDLAMINDHRGCVDYLIYCHTPSGGGVYHRAASTIQAAWRYYRHKCRVATSRQWCAVVIQRSFRLWLGRRRARRVREARMRLRERAARVIQSHWRLYIREKRRYEATYVQLKTRLQQEHLATALILTELHSQTQNIRLPPVTTISTATATGALHNKSFKPPPPSSGGLNPSYLLKVSHNPTPIFPSGSLMFPAQPRKPLIKTAPPNIRMKRPSLGMRLPSVGMTSVNLESNPITPPPSPANEQELPESAKINSKGRTRLPLMPVSPSLTSGQSESNQTTRGSLNALTSRDSLNTVSKGMLTNRASHKTVSNETLTSRGSSNKHSSQPKLPPISNNTSLVVSEEAEKIAQQPVDVPREKDSTATVAMASESHDQVSSSPMRVQLHSMMARKSVFKDVPLGFKPIASLKKQHDRITTVTVHTPPVSPSSEEMVLSDEDLTDGVSREERETVAVDQPSPSDSSHFLNHIQRYDRLNEVLGLLQQAKQVKQEESLDGETPTKMSSLKQHIKTALDEAVRLRAETEAMQLRVTEGTRQTNTVNS